MTPLPRRFYAKAAAHGRSVLLDTSILRTPGGKEIVLPTTAMASAIAAEWEAQGDHIILKSMPLTSLVYGVFDRVQDDMAGIRNDVLKYLGTELVCHYSDNTDVLAFQKARWQPLHAWLQKTYGTTLPVTTTLQAMPEGDTAWAAQQIGTYDAFRLAALYNAVHLTGSFVIGLALVEGRLNAAEALGAAEAEADYQAEKWGADDELVQRRIALGAELASVQNFVNLLKA
ncbi:MAG: ATP12 family protein [Bdellovibrionales bacterium]